MDIVAINSNDIITITLLYFSIHFLLQLLRALFRRIRFIFFDDLHKDYTEPGDIQLNTDVYPKGWMHVAETRKLAVGTILKVRAFGKDIVLMRDSNGKVHAMDPYCPHNGAHLGAGEIVSIRGEDCIKCPFHEWSFRAEDGVCVEVPYAKDRKAPKGSSLKIWPCVEENGFIYIWSQNGETSPSWYPEAIEEIKSGELIYYDRVKLIVNVDLHTLSEQTTDFPHFVSVHDKPTLLGKKIAKMLGLGEKLVHHVFDEFSWKPKEKPNQHQAVLTYRPHYEFFNKKIATNSVRVTQSGPFMYSFHIHIEIFGITFKRLVLLSVHCISGRKKEVIFHLYSEKNLLSKLLNRFMLLGLFAQTLEDGDIWSEVCPPIKPLFLREEKASVHLRRWLLQFDDHKSNCNSNGYSTQ